MPVGRRLVLGGLGALALTLPGAAQGAPWRAACGFAESNYHTRNLRIMIAEVAEATGDALAIDLHAAGTLFPQRKIFRAVQENVVQLGDILLAAYGNYDPIFDADGIPGLVRNENDARRMLALQEPLIEARFTRQGLRLLYLAPWAHLGIVANDRLEGPAALRGMSVRSFGPMSTRFATLLGARSSVVDAMEVRQRQAAGDFGAQLTTAVVAADNAAWDQGRFFIHTRLATSKNAVFVNRRAFDQLRASQRDALLAAAEAAGHRAWGMAETAQVEAETLLQSHGMQVMEASPALAAAMEQVGARMLAEWELRAGEEGRRLLAAYADSGARASLKQP